MRIQSYSSFLKQIHSLAREKEFPLRVMWELTYRCNFKCRHCYVPDSYKKKLKEELSTEEIFSILDQLADIGCFYLGFTGGEPFLREDLLKILWYAKKKGFQIIIYTNGSLIDKAKAKELKRLSPNKVDITLPAVNKKAFERITQVAGSYAKVFKTIDLLSKEGVNLGLKTCLLKENEKEIKDIQNFAASLGALHRLDDRLSPRLDGSPEPYQYRGILKNEESASCDELGLRLAVSGKRLSVGGSYSENRKPKTENHTPRTDTLFKCGVGVSQAAITPFGELKMCLMIDYPKYKILTENKKDSRLSVVGCRLSPNTANRTPKTENRTAKVNLKEAWERLKELVVAIKPDGNYKCDRCNLYNYCKWCPAMAWLYNRSFTSCDSENRSWAEEKKINYEDRN